MTDAISNRPKRILYADIIRIFAVICVIFNHTNTDGFVHFTTYEVGSGSYWFYMFFSVTAVVSVPLFFMVSGMFLLDRKDETITDIWKKRVSKYVVVLLIFSALHYARNQYFDPSLFSITDFLKRVYTNDVIIPYGFLYSYIAYLIGLPFIRKMARSLNGKEFLYLVGLQFFFTGAVFMIQYRLSGGTLSLCNNLRPIFILESVVFYPLTGYYLGRRLKQITGKMILISLFFFVLSIGSTMYMTNYKILLTHRLGEGEVSFFYGSMCCFQAIFIFLIIRKIFESITLPLIIERILTNMGKCTFGIYLIEQAFRESLCFFQKKMSDIIGPFAAAIIVVLSVFLICWILTAAFYAVISVIRWMNRIRKSPQCK